MKILAAVVGALLILIGGVWIAQGINILPGSFMTGQIQWAIYGAVAAMVGAALIWWARRRALKSAGPSDTIGR